MKALLPPPPPGSPAARWGSKGLWLLMPVLLFGGLWAVVFYFREPLPLFEDAAMLLRYAGHLAAGEGIVWNPGEAPVDGATDFLYMVLCAALIRLGIEGPLATALLAGAAHLLTVVLVFRSHFRQPDGRLWAAVMSALVVATGPALNYVEAGFGTPVFALFGLLTWAEYQACLQHGLDKGRLWRFSVFALLMGLTRPEGVLLVLVMAALLFWTAQESRSLKRLSPFLWAFVLPGAVYFAWHWWYFGHPLPNPFYVKGGGSLYLSSLKASALGLAYMAGPLLLVMATAAFRSRDRRLYLRLILPVIAFAMAWILMSNAMNYSFRFQYLLMPIVWVLWWPVVKGLIPVRMAARAPQQADGRPLPPSAWVMLSIACGLAMLTFQGLYWALPARIHPDGRADLGLALRPLASQGVYMAVTEAGNLPYYSGWPAIDTWGLNDKEIAHAGTLGQDRLREVSPALVMVHDYWSPGTPKQRPEERWAVMTDTLEAYLRLDYDLVACWGREAVSCHFYYVRRDHPLADRLRGQIQGFPYRWYEDGELAQNFLR